MNPIVLSSNVGFRPRSDGAVALGVVVGVAAKEEEEPEGTRPLVRGVGATSSTRESRTERGSPEVELNRVAEGGSLMQTRHEPASS